MKVTIKHRGVNDCVIEVAGTDSQGFSVCWHVDGEDQDAIGVDYEAFGDDFMEAIERLENYIRGLRGIADGDTAELFEKIQSEGRDEYYGLIGAFGRLKRAEAVELAELALRMLRAWMRHESRERCPCECQCHDPGSVRSSGGLCKAEGCGGRVNFGWDTYCERHACRHCGDARDCLNCEIDAWIDAYAKDIDGRARGRRSPIAHTKATNSSHGVRS